MPFNKPKKEKDWSSIMDQIEAEASNKSEGSQELEDSSSEVPSSEIGQFETVQPELQQSETPQPENSHREETTQTSEDQDGSSGPLPHLAPSTSFAPRKTGKSSFLDRLASMNLFGTTSPEKVDRSAAVPQAPFSQVSQSESEPLESRSLGSIHSENTEESQCEGEADDMDSSVPQGQEKVFLADVADPWSRIAKQVNERIKDSPTDADISADSVNATEPQCTCQSETAESETDEMFDPDPDFDEFSKSIQSSEAAEVAERPEKQDEYAVPDIEELVSFRDLPPIKKKAPPPTPSISAGPVVISSLPPRENSGKPSTFERSSSKNGVRDSKKSPRDRDVRKEKSSTTSEKAFGKSFDKPTARNTERNTEKSFEKPVRAERVERPERTERIEQPERAKSSKTRKSRTGDSFGKERLEISSVYDEPIELDELDLVAPTRPETLPAYSLGQFDDDDEEEITVVRSRKSRNKKTSPKKSREPAEDSDHSVYEKTTDDYSTTPRYAANYFEEVDEIEDDYEDVLVSPAEREYGPSRDVFADLIPDSLDDGLFSEVDDDFDDEMDSDLDSELDDDLGDVEDEEQDIIFPTPSPSKSRGSRTPGAAPSERSAIRPVVRQSYPGAGSVDSSSETSANAEKSPKSRLTRGSKVRPTSVERPTPERANLDDDEDDIFAGFSQKPKRGSAFDPAARRPERPARSSSVKDKEFEEEPSVVEKKKVRTRTASKKVSEPDFRDERDEQEELEMMRLHKAIPSWDDAILPVVEANIAKHSQRRNVKKR